MIYGIGDLHLDYLKQKPMDIFGDNWIMHEEKIFNNWVKVVKEDDLVLIPGDVSWSLRMNEGIKDLSRVNDLPGMKVIIKGNHDYWWESKKKMDALGLENIYFIQNDSYIYKNIAIAGNRGWYPKDTEGFTAHDKKMFERELSRLNLSLSTIREGVDKKIVMLHYPPFNFDLKPNEFTSLMKEYNVDICIYGHLHSEGHKYVVEGNIEGIQYYCVSSDYIDFSPRKII
jgi:hypothetical protein